MNDMRQTNRKSGRKKENCCGLFGVGHWVGFGVWVGFVWAGE